MRKKSLVPKEYKSCEERLAYLEGYRAGLRFGKKTLKSIKVK